MLCSIQSKHNQRLLDHAKRSATDALKTASKRAIQKTEKATDDFIDNGSADEITKVLRMAPQNSLETVENKMVNTVFDR